jgi:hypothetical protein
MENDASKSSYIVACVLVAAVTFLPSRFLAELGDTRTDTQTGGRDLWSVLLRWAQVPWYTFQVS